MTREVLALGARSGVTAFLACVAVCHPCELKACSCVVPSVRESFARANAVFVGKVVCRVPAQSGYGLDFEFDVEKSWKGAGQTPWIVRTGHGGGDCGCEFKV